MTADVNGTWIATVEGDLNGVYYTYQVDVDGVTYEACDPYAQTTGVNGKRAMVIDLDSTDPEGWENDTAPLAAAIVLTSQGTPFFQAGEEMLRSKPTEDGFEHNSYKSPDSVNSIKWDTLSDAAYADAADYYAGLIAFRKAHPALRMTTAEGSVTVDAVSACVLVKEAAVEETPTEPAGAQTPAVTPRMTLFVALGALAVVAIGGIVMFLLSERKKEIKMPDTSGVWHFCALNRCSYPPGLPWQDRCSRHG